VRCHTDPARADADNILKSSALTDDDVAIHPPDWKLQMKTGIKPVEAILMDLGIRLPVEFLSRLDIEEYLDELDKAVTLVTGERQRLGDLLRGAEHITPRQLEQALSQQRRYRLGLGEILIRNGVLTLRESDALLEFLHRRKGVETASSHFSLGNILVANQSITRDQLEEALRRQLETGRRLGEELIHAGDASRSQISSGLSLQRRLIAWALAITTALAPIAVLVPAAVAGQAGATLAVSVTVIAEAKIQSNHQLTKIEITAADIARGYVEIQSASRFSVFTNSPLGYSVEFHPVGSIFESAQVVGLGRAVQLGADGGTVFVRGPLAPNAMHDLNYRFTLSPDTLPGSYPWPLAFSVHALS